MVGEKHVETHTQEEIDRCVHLFFYHCHNFKSMKGDSSLGQCLILLGAAVLAGTFKHCSYLVQFNPHLLTKFSSVVFWVRFRIFYFFQVEILFWVLDPIFYWFGVCVLFWDRVLMESPCWSGTQYMDQADQSKPSASGFSIIRAAGVNHMSNYLFCF